MSEPKRTGLLDLLRESQGCQFVIPVYQRNYTWVANEQIKQYLNDLENVINGNYKNHFMGIIIYLEKSLDFANREFSIIDGQQRLTTTFLTLYAIRKILEEQNDLEKIKQLDGQLLTNPFASEKIKYKLKPLVSDDDVYRCIAENRVDEIIDVSSNVFVNYNYIISRIRKWIDGGHDINKILIAMDKLYVVCVPISEEDNVQKIFESINATGAKLTAADLIRNFLLMDLKSDVQEKYYSKYWNKLEENISKDSKELELFFRMFIAIKTYNLVPKNSVYREFVQWIEENDINIKDLFEELLEFSKTYDFIYNSDISGLDNILKNALIDYRKINSDLPMPLVIEFCRLYRMNKINSNKLGMLIDSINAYLIRRSICDINSQNISKLFPTVLKKTLDACNEDYENVVQVLNQEMVGNNAGTSGSYMPTDKQMHELLEYANVYKRPTLRIIFDRLELNNNPAPVDLSALSIEHLMPQTPSEQWLAELNTDLETYQNNIHRIGNLTLATKPDNSKMGNATWDYKNEVLKDTMHLTMNIDLLPIEHWDIKHIELRTNELIDRICGIYPYPKVKIINNNPGSVDEDKAIDIAIKLIGCASESIKRNTFLSNDKKEGYVFASSKMYQQGDKEKFWFGYRPKSFEIINQCKSTSMVLICRNQKPFVVRLPKEFLDENREYFNISIDDQGEISHYHIVVFLYSDKHVSMLLSHPVVKEIDITKYARGIE